MSAPDRYAVIGHPIAHSRSPQIHALFAKQTHQSMTYTALDVAPEASGGASARVLCHRRVRSQRHGAAQGSGDRIDRESDARARTAGAANTILRDAAGNLIADNTDGAGLVRDLTHNLHIGVRAQRVLLLGAGGAARGVLAPLLELKPRQLVIANRGVERALALASAFAAMGPVRGAGFGELDGLCFDLIINATAAGLQAQVPPLPPSSDRRGDDLLRSDLCRWRHPFHALGAQARRRAGSHGTWHAGRTGRRILLSVARRATGHHSGAGSARSPGPALSRKACSRSFGR